MAENKPSKCKGPCGKRRVLNEQGLCRECTASSALGHFDAEPRAAQFLEPRIEIEAQTLVETTSPETVAEVVESLPEQPDELPRSIREIHEMPRFPGNSRDRRRQRRAWERQAKAK